MAKTKGEIAQEALSDIGYSGSVPSDILLTGVNNLERMVSGWINKNLNVSYSFSPSPAPTQDSGISSFNEDAIITNLSKRLASVFDIIPNPELVSRAGQLYSELMNVAPPEYESHPYQPLGAGSTRCYEYIFEAVYQERDQIVEVHTGDSKMAEVDFSSFAPASDISAITWTSQTSTIDISNIETVGSKTSALLTFNRKGSYAICVRAAKTNGETQTATLSYRVIPCQFNEGVDQNGSV